jgi:hypothetical protein
MVLRVLHFIRLPLLMLVIFTVGRFLLGLNGVPYAPRGNAIFGIVVLTITSALYWGALSKRVGHFGWAGTVLVGIGIGLSAQILIFLATALSYAMGVETYFTHWDALNVPEGTKLAMGEALQRRLGGLLFGPITAIIFACIGRLLAPLAPAPEDPGR